MDYLPYDLFVTIRGKVQGLLKGGATEKGYAGSIEALAFTYQASQPTASGMATGKLEHSPVTIVKQWDSASTQLFMALTNNESLESVVLTFVPAPTRSGPNRGAAHVITLKVARVSKIALHRDSPAPGATGTAHDLEEVSFVFQQIEFSDLHGGSAAAAASNIGSSGSSPPPLSPLTVGLPQARPISLQPLRFRGM
jgi:type VI secretion system secreted protein Hcp